MGRRTLGYLLLCVFVNIQRGGPQPHTVFVAVHSGSHTPAVKTRNHRTTMLACHSFLPMSYMRRIHDTGRDHACSLSWACHRITTMAVQCHQVGQSVTRGTCGLHVQGSLTCECHQGARDHQAIGHQDSGAHHLSCVHDMCACMRGPDARALPLCVSRLVQNYSPNLSCGGCPG